MASKKRSKSVAGSEKAMLPNARAVGDVDPQERIEVTLLLRPRNANRNLETRAAHTFETGNRLPEEREYLSHEQLAAEHGADPEDLSKVEAFAHEHHLTVVQANIGQRTIQLSGTLADLTAAFSPKLKRYKLGKIAFRGRTGAVLVPEDLAEIVVGVFGFDNRPAFRPHCRALFNPNLEPRAAESGKRVVRRIDDKARRIAPRNAPDGSFLPTEIAKLYNFPQGVDGSGQCIALIELNTPNSRGQIGTGFNAKDLKAYFKKLNLPLPQVTAIGVDHGANIPGINQDTDGEVMLDIEVAGAIAPGAKIALYFAPNTDKGFIDAISAAVHDTIRKPSVVSISWGGPEDVPFTTQQMRDAINQIFQDAAALGVTICSAAGDEGSSDLPLQDQGGNRLRDGKPHVDFPSSSPFALACGGTKLLGAGTKITSESVWNEGDSHGAGGGGVSNFFAKPDFQASLIIPTSPTGTAGRGVPDVAADADPTTGYRVRVAGKMLTFGGTSAVAPLWAGLVALINQRLANLGKKSCGFINPILYKTTEAFHDITTGNNDIDGTLSAYKAHPGWDACTGLGTPDGNKVMKALGG